ncbi:hypothetical protein HanPI659440_Chr06g0225571 [Helianthus annuus]|nr:hypothetical protein HanPI659440_Chr06g0225571 [Helianthus annuus]
MFGSGLELYTCRSGSSFIWVFLVNGSDLHSVSTRSKRVDSVNWSTRVNSISRLIQSWSHKFGSIGGSHSSDFSFEFDSNKSQSTVRVSKSVNARNFLSNHSQRQSTQDPE